MGSGTSGNIIKFNKLIIINNEVVVPNILPKKLLVAGDLGYHYKLY